MELGRAHRTVLAIFSIALKAEVIFFHAYAGGLRTPREMHRFWEWQLAAAINTSTCGSLPKG